MRKYSILVLICTVLGVLWFTYVQLSFTHINTDPQAQPSTSVEWLQALKIILITNVVGLLIYHADQLLDHWIKWQTNFLFRFVSGFVVNTAAGLVLIYFTTSRWLHFNSDETTKLIILFVIALFIYEIFYGLFYSYRYYAYTQVEQLRSDRWQLELQFESLKNQISPHYLFNCLNTISSLLFKDSQMAEEFIRRMADSFRYVLKHQKQRLVTLREEIEFVKSYYYLLQVRFEHHLKLEINLPKNVQDSFVPPLTIQMLVENAVKHNQISKEHPLLVYISAVDNKYLQVTSTKTTPSVNMVSFRVGLDNIRNRYQFFTNEPIKVKDDERFMVQLPVITKIKNSTLVNGSVKPLPSFA